MIKVFPADWIPNEIRQYHVIFDISFCLHVNNKYLESVNYATVKTSPQQSMGQLGSTLKRLVALMSYNYDL